MKYDIDIHAFEHDLRSTLIEQFRLADDINIVRFEDNEDSNINDYIVLGESTYTYIEDNELYNLLKEYSKKHYKTN